MQNKTCPRACVFKSLTQGRWAVVTFDKFRNISNWYGGFVDQPAAFKFAFYYVKELRAND